MRTHGVVRSHHRKITTTEQSRQPGCLALHSSGGGLLSIFALVLAQSLSTSLGSPVQDGLTVLVHLELDNDQLAGVDAHIDGGSVGLLPLDPLNVDTELLPVTLDYLPNLLAFVVTADNLREAE